MSRLPTILHVDMDAFFASVEALEDPKLRNIPLIVGGDGARGVVASCSYEARFFGVRSAMPSAVAKRMCPQATFVSGHYELYEKYSKLMHAVFDQYTPFVEGISLDEAFLDVSGALRLFGSPAEIGKRIRSQIFDDLGLHASVGVATTKHLAKLASEDAKPKPSKNGSIAGKGVVVIDDDNAIEFLHALPVRALWGVGPASASKLEKLGITSVRQLARTPEAALASALGKASAEHLQALAWNRDEREVVVGHDPKSIGHEQTFPTDLKTKGAVHQHYVRLCDAVATRLRQAGLRGRTVTAKIRYGSFETITRARTLDEPTSNAAVLLSTIDEVLEIVDVGAGVRLIGVSVSKLEAHLGQSQLTLGDDADAIVLDDVIDEIRHRFGDDAVAPAQLLTQGHGVLQKGERQWGPNK